MVDKTLVLRKFTELEDHLKHLKEFGRISTQEYKTSWKTQRIVERTLQIMIELCVDIANHIIGDQAYRVPTSYADTFRVLEEENILGSKRSNTMQEMAKFRNIIVHGYDKVDETIVVNILKNRLNDFIDYRDKILVFIKRVN